MDAQGTLEYVWAPSTLPRLNHGWPCASLSPRALVETGHADEVMSFLWEHWVRPNEPAGSRGAVRYGRFKPKIAWGASISCSMD